MGQADHNDYLFTAAAAQMLRISARKLYELIDIGQLPAYKVAGRIGIRRSEIEKLLGSNPDEE